MPKKTAFLGTPGWVQNPERYSKSDLMKAAGANTGNLIFQYSASRLAGGHTEHVGFSGKGYGDIDVFRDLDYFVFPAANHLRTDGDWTSLASYLALLRVPLVVLGLGAQAEHGANPKATAAEVRAHAPAMSLVDVLREKAALITVRGRFSEAVCHELGLKDVIRNGCPSQYINPDRELGRHIGARLAALRDGDASAQIAVTASAPNELKGWRRDVEARLVRWLSEDGGLYIQQSCSTDLFDGLAGHLAQGRTPEHVHLYRALSEGGGTEASVAAALAKTFRMFFDARNWFKAIEATDLAIGTRIHGNMAALAASRPGVLVLHDARVAELAEEMHVPRIDSDAFLPAGSLKQVLAAVEFDGDAFDAARLAKSRMLADAFQKIGLPPSKHLLELAGAGVGTAAQVAGAGGH